MLKATCASIIAAAALIAVPVSAQTTDYGASTSMSTDTRGTTGTGDQYMRTQENYTESYQEQSFESSTPAEPASEYNFTHRDDDYQAHPQGDQRYSHSQEWRDTEDARYHMHQQALVPGSSHDAWWASDSLTNQSREGYVGTPYLWDSDRYYPDPSFN